MLALAPKAANVRFVQINGYHNAPSKRQKAPRRLRRLQYAMKVLAEASKGLGEAHSAVAMFGVRMLIERELKGGQHAKRHESP